MNKLRLLLPSEGALSEGALNLLEKNNISVIKEKSRKYLGALKGMDVDVLFQRSSDITEEVEILKNKCNSIPGAISIFTGYVRDFSKNKKLTSKMINF